MRCKCGKLVSEEIPLNEEDPMCEDCFYDYVSEMEDMHSEDLDGDIDEEFPEE